MQLIVIAKGADELVRVYRVTVITSGTAYAIAAGIEGRQQEIAVTITTPPPVEMVVSASIITVTHKIVPSIILKSTIYNVTVGSELIEYKTFPL